MGDVPLRDLASAAARAERTALKLMQQLPVNYRDRLPVGQPMPLGEEDTIVWLPHFLSQDPPRHPGGAPSRPRQRPHRRHGTRSVRAIAEIWREATGPFGAIAASFDLLMRKGFDPPQLDAEV